MELYHLRTFVAVAETESVTQAAAQLFTTPPSVSAHIKALESELKLALFIRTPRGMKLTPQGARLYEKALAALSAVQAVVDQAVALQAQLVSEVNIGVNAAPVLLRLPALINLLQAQHPGLRLNLVGSVSGRILEQVQKGALDAGFVYGDPRTADLSMLDLAEIALVVAVSPTWEPSLDGGRWEDIAALPWIASSCYCPFEALSDALFAKRGLAVHKVTTADDGATKLDLVRSGVGIAVLERAEALPFASAGEIVLWEPEPLRCKLTFVWQTRRTDEPVLATLRAALAQVWACALAG